jgi:hypothetical protein
MMDVQMAPPPYAAAGNFAPPVGRPPVLGSQIPGTTGGLPAAAGLSATANPMANQLQSMGRGEDSMLVHMTPGEVNSLQGLAMANGGSLTINPETGLPEAGFLKKLLPTILGAGLMLIPGVNALAAAGMVGAGSIAKTGSLKKGLMAGLSAYGGASLAGGLGAGNVFGAAAKNAAPAVSAGSSAAADMAREIAGTTAVNTAGQTAAKTGLAGLAQNFGNAAKAGLPGGIIGKAAPKLAAMGLMQGVSGAMTPSGGGMAAPDGRVDNSFQGPYYAQDRQRILDPEGPLSSKPRRHFAVDMPEIYNTMGQVVQPGSHTVRGTQIMQPVLNPSAKKAKDDKGKPMYSFVPTTYMGGVDPNPGMVAPDQAMIAPNQDDMYGYTGYAGGGEVELSDGAFVLDARTVSEIGNGSSNAGLEALRRIGGRPVEGMGDGVSDSVPARIGRDQPARVARDEAIIPADAVKRIGKGNAKRGADKLYSLMNKAHKARKKAGRGQDTKLRHGLG